MQRRPLHSVTGLLAVQRARVQPLSRRDEEALHLAAAQQQQQSTTSDAVVATRTCHDGSKGADKDDEMEAFCVLISPLCSRPRQRYASPAEPMLSSAFDSCEAVLRTPLDVPDCDVDRASLLDLCDAAVRRYIRHHVVHALHRCPIIAP